MFKSKVLVSLVLAIYMLFAIFGFVGKEAIAFTLDSLILPLIAFSYYTFFKEKRVYFALFLTCYAASDLIGLIVNYIPFTEASKLIFTLDYYIGNALYVAAYVFLFIGICKNLNVLHILKNFIIHIIVLIALNVWLIYVLQNIVENQNDLFGSYYLELIYNVIMLLLLSGALLNYFYRDNQKSLYLFLGALCIVFSEVIDVAYLYISQRALLNFLSTSLVLLAFYFFCKQLTMSDIKEEERQIYFGSSKSTEA
ncbi:hypothetical protein E1J38_014335 [Seonamhaeicola sediminis]|uniref:Lysoplasmalogenase n=1 Tax=Seonamhaeicola sediminis TaxID=2528206 RepID=A0A562Y8Z0_9FLAO|nr:hypothetical protein [Seonamhaeicola sediminis]TWO30884.1 hypothetical protein E1J38_014335 [Seonamhaeicola sediminis]